MGMVQSHGQRIRLIRRLEVGQTQNLADHIDDLLFFGLAVTRQAFLDFHWAVLEYFHAPGFAQEQDHAADLTEFHQTLAIVAVKEGLDDHHRGIVFANDLFQLSVYYPQPLRLGQPARRSNHSAVDVARVSPLFPD